MCTCTFARATGPGPQAHAGGGPKSPLPEHRLGTQLGATLDSTTSSSVSDSCPPPPPRRRFGAATIEGGKHEILSTQRMRKRKGGGEVERKTEATRSGSG